MGTGFDHWPVLKFEIFRVQHFRGGIHNAVHRGLRLAKAGHVVCPKMADTRHPDGLGSREPPPADNYRQAVAQQRVESAHVFAARVSKSRSLVHTLEGVAPAWKLPKALKRDDLTARPPVAGREITRASGRQGRIAS